MALNRTFAPASLMALAMGMASPAWAADEAKKENGTPEIVVTAQFRSQKLQDTPLAITAMNGAALAARGQTNIA